MRYKVEIFDLVYIQIVETTSHYDAISPELGYSFETEARLLLRKLEVRPLSLFNLSDGKHRRISFQRFPYMFVFEVIKDRVYVKLLYPQRADPAELIKKLKSNLP
jgi:hypothetical protein